MVKTEATQREIGVIFAGDMVRAILEGRKDVTRRLKFSGKPGDIIWVRERWAPENVYDSFSVIDLKEIVGVDATIRYAVSFNRHRSERGQWRPSIHMPRWAARLFLRVLDVREERLQDIDARECFREGVATGQTSFGSGKTFDEVDRANIENFAALWDSIYGKKPGQSWADNPTVYRVEFEVMK